MYPSSVRNLIECLKGLPGIGEKSAERMAYSIINFDGEKLDDFASSLIEIKNLKRCSICNNITDNDICNICNDDNRSSNTIFVVEKPKDVALFEKMGNYHGKYRILGAVLGGQKQYLSVAASADLMIGIGDITGSYEMAMLGPKAKKFWRVAEDGVLRDMTHSLSAMFYMREIDFFEKYA